MQQRSAIVIVCLHVYCPGCPPEGDECAPGGHNLRLKAFCHFGALLPVLKISGIGNCDTKPLLCSIVDTVHVFRFIHRLLPLAVV